VPQRSILAGHKTTSTAVSWTLFEHAQHADIQSQLRAELRAFPLPAAAAGNAPLDADTLAEQDKLPLLDAVVCESLRVHALVQNMGRVATEDTAIPLARPFADRAGALQHEIRVRKGDLITLPIGAVHRDEGMWGADARA
jgi:cytochrome P450